MYFNEDYSNLYLLREMEFFCFVSEIITLTIISFSNFQGNISQKYLFLNSCHARTLGKLQSSDCIKVVTSATC